ncbi:DUF523 and DUF1722 domain-containing protein [Deferrisoma camini]|uniref:DUF523 and DUF1722 domain-containing protein n=1 Tax=Deferrisoma camini TaxID=1035120 RepID=UPI00046D8BFD|nr:DUF523 and DUF1722 domain-containing protein [Deferrisoma camini]
METHARLRILVSACLLGDPVRYDGGHKLDPAVAGLAPWAELVAVCPEAEAGLGVPREAMDLVGDPAGPRAVTVETGRDRTKELAAVFRRRAADLAALEPDAAILKARSPSCAVESARVYPQRPRQGDPVPGRGLFAAELARRAPLLPLAEETDLHRPEPRAHLFRRVFTLRRWRAARATAPDPRALRKFHERERLGLLSHDPDRCRGLERLAVSAADRSVDEAWARYEALLLETLARRPTRRAHAVALRHGASVVAEDLDAGDRGRLAAAIRAYEEGGGSLAAVASLLRELARRKGRKDLADSPYLAPHPLELGE